MKKWTMDTKVLIKNLTVIANSKVEAMEKAKKNLMDTLRDSNIPFDENDIKIDEKSITLSID